MIQDPSSIGRRLGAMLYEQLPLRLPGHLLPGVALPAIRQARFGGAGGVRGAALLNL